jgi:hypothetical protein
MSTVSYSYGESTWEAWPVGPARRDNVALLVVPALSIGLAGGVVWFIHQAFFVLGIHPWPLWVETACGAACAYLLSVATSLGLRRLTWRDTRKSPEDEIQGPAATAVWCAPWAILAAHSSPVSLVAGGILLVSATRLMFFRWEEAVEGPPAAPPSDGGYLFTFESPLSHAGPPGLPVLTAIAAEASIFMFAIGRSYSGLSAAGVGIMLSVLIISRETQRPHREAAAPVRRAALSLLVVVALALAAQALPFQRKYGKAPARPKSAQEHLSVSSLNGLAAASRRVSGNKDEVPPPNVGGAEGGYPGIILWPEVRPVVLLVPPLPSGTGRLKYSRNPLGIPFGGEYWMYRDPNRRPPLRSYFRRGSPLLGVFQTTDHRPLRMEARHKLEQPIDIRCCSEVRLLILNSDPNPAEVSIELMLLGPRQTLGSELSLGTSSISSRAGPAGAPAQETLPFAVPPVQYQFDEFRVVFHRSPDHSDKSALIAVDRFVLVPR